MNSIVIYATIFYAVAIALISYYYRGDSSYLSFTSGNKSFGWFVTAAALFTLIGGGELIAGSTFGYQFGWYGTALFAGYTIAFIALGILAPRLYASISSGDITYPDYVRNIYGDRIYYTILIVQTVTFFFLIVLQISAGATVLDTLGVPYWVAAGVISGLVTLYLIIGGYRAVSLTDVVQGVIMLGLLVLVIYRYYASAPQMLSHTSNFPGFENFWGVLLSGVIIGLASADVWQRLLTARSGKEARTGLIIGGLLLGSYGILIVSIGVIGKALGLSNGERVFLDFLLADAPLLVRIFAITAVIAAIMSTADTEVFLVSTLLQKTIQKKEALESSGAATNRIYIVSVTLLAYLFSYLGRDLAEFYNWMFVSYMIFAPTIAITLFLNMNESMFVLSLSLTAIAFFVLLFIGFLTLQNSYLLSIPALVTSALYYVSKRVNHV